MAIEIKPQESILLPGLRKATEAAHQQIERQPNMVRLMASDLKLHEYITVLLGFTLFFQKIEPQIIDQFEIYSANNAGNNLSYTYTPRLPLLAEDIKAMQNKIMDSSDAADILFLQQGLSKNAGQQEPQPSELENITWPNISNHLELLAVLYVLEGSSQGGKILAPRINRTLSLNEAGCKYFNLWIKPSNSWIQWQEWCKQIEAQESSKFLALNAPKIYHTAKQTFTAISNCMDKVGAQLLSPHS
ncbi:hypothetical protein A28LD_0429 [Idiomarina sp. A28L]|uniref:biliverdin-producing heme oxygenase n=1 Tax=Idiomarina sp. A28L TaxID=1036674 RepID=UPI0002138B74|nr:biliverdin-producing heme oxygenase [Idiomarina sp. A28L]EGN75941.1 hypothetical protein A28LD_0429 [Idiomarina sp. A28L]